MYSTSSMGQNECIIYSFIPMSCEKYGHSIDGHPLSELLEQGLIEKLEKFFNIEKSGFKVDYKNCDKFTNIIIKW